METTKISVTLGSRSYDISVPSGEFLDYLKDELEELKNKDNSIDVIVFLNHYLKKSYLNFKIIKEVEELRNEKISLENKLKNQELELQNIFNRLKEEKI